MLDTPTLTLTPASGASAMLTTTHALFDTAAQLGKTPITVGDPMPCGACGVTIIKTAPNSRICASCRSARLEARKTAYKATRRKTAWAQGSIRPCEACAEPIVREYANTAYCKPCAADRKARMLREYKRANRDRFRPAGVEKVKGTHKCCEHCGNSFPRKNHGAKYCETCSPIIWRLDPRRRISLGVGNAIRKSLGSEKRRRHWEALVGFTLEELRRHIERQFLPGMSWENWGDWHVDHILPLSSFHFDGPDDPEFRAAWALTNLRPLWARANLAKNNKRTLLL